MDLLTASQFLNILRIGRPQHLSNEAISNVSMFFLTIVFASVLIVFLIHKISKNQNDENVSINLSIIENKYRECQEQIVQIRKLYPLQTTSSVWRDHVNVISSKFYYEPEHNRCYYVINKSILGNKALYQCTSDHFILIAEEEATFSSVSRKRGTINVRDVIDAKHKNLISSDCAEYYLLATSYDRWVPYIEEFVLHKFNNCDAYLMKYFDGNPYTLLSKEM